MTALSSQVDAEAIRTTAMLLAVEQWPKIYSQAPEQHAVLLKQTAKFQLLLTRFFKNMANHAGDFVNWNHYNYQLAQTKLDRSKLDYNVEVIVNDDQIDQNSTNFIKVNLQTVQDILIAGAQAGEAIYGKPLSIASSSHKFQQRALKQVASLVGKKVMPDGSIVDNPKAEYNILDTVRNDIAQSVKTSLGLGETTDEATQRLSDIIADLDRAELIAQTESVNAYNVGTMEYADDSGAVGKEWEDAGADDECATNAAQGPIPIDEDFDSGDSEPTAHPRCKCGNRLIYQQEWDDNGYGDGTSGNTRPTGIAPEDQA